MLTIEWIAEFKDGSFLKQYEETPEGHRENLFKDVLDRSDDLVRFCLLNTRTGVIYIVDLTIGCIYQTAPKVALPEPRADMLRSQDYTYRLIYFREVTREFGSNLRELGSPRIVYFLGFQYTDENGKNHKRLCRILEDGRLVVN